MRTINIIALLIAFSFNIGNAQNKSKSQQTRTIEINNDNGSLSISFQEGEITEFIVNGNDVNKDEYDSYQEIIDDFSDDGNQPPSPPTPPNTDNTKSETLYAMMIEYLMEEGAINSFTKYEVELKRKYLKVNGKKVSSLFHQECLDFFDEIYGHRLNFDSHVKMKRSGEESTSSISIVNND